MRKRAATKGDLVVEVKPGEEVTSVNVGWTVEKFVAAANGRENGKKNGRGGVKTPAAKGKEPKGRGDKGKPAAKAKAVKGGGNKGKGKAVAKAPKGKGKTAAKGKKSKK
jgi:hypothetical protein